MIHVSQIILWETQWCHQLVEQINSTLLDCSWWSLPHWGPDQPAGETQEGPQFAGQQWLSFQNKRVWWLTCYMLSHSDSVNANSWVQSSFAEHRSMEFIPAWGEVHPTALLHWVQNNFIKTVIKKNTFSIWKLVRPFLYISFWYIKNNNYNKITIK